MFFSRHIYREEEGREEGCSEEVSEPARVVFFVCTAGEQREVFSNC